MNQLKSSTSHIVQTVTVLISAYFWAWSGAMIAALFLLAMGLCFVVTALLHVLHLQRMDYVTGVKTGMFPFLVGSMRGMSRRHK